MTSITLRNQFTERIWYQVQRNSTANVTLADGIFEQNKAVSLNPATTSNPIRLGSEMNTVVYTWVGENIGEGTRSDALIVFNRTGDVMQSRTNDKIAFISIGVNKWGIQEASLISEKGEGIPHWALWIIGGFVTLFIIVILIWVFRQRDHPIYRMNPSITPTV